MTLLKCMILTFLLAGSILLAQVPRTISFQGVLTDAAGNIVGDGNHQLRLQLYTTASGGSAIHSETQTIPVVKGVFNVIIGSVTPLPASLAFDRAYFLGVTVDAGSELAPRTALTSVPYALHAAEAKIAQALAPGAGGAVTSVNGQDGSISLQGAGGTTVTNSGRTFTISSTTGGGGGIQGVQSTDGTLTITDPNGPTANLAVAQNAIGTLHLRDGAVSGSKIENDAVGAEKIQNGAVGNAKIQDDAVSAIKIQDYAIGSSKIATAAVGGEKLQDAAVSTEKIADLSVTASKLANGSVTAGKVSPVGASPGEVLKYDGVDVGWAAESGSFALPYTGSTATADYAFAVSNTGTGPAAEFTIQNTSNTSNALIARTYGSGYAIVAENAGSGAAIIGESTLREGVSGFSRDSSGVSGGSYNGTGITGGSENGCGVMGFSGGARPGVYGHSDGFCGVQGHGSEYGVFGNGGRWGVMGVGSGAGILGYSLVPGNGEGVFGQSITGRAVRGLSQSGIGVAGDSPTGYGTSGTGGNIGVYAHNISGISGRDAYLATPVLSADFYGDVVVHGSLAKAGGSFRIDHPLDPENKYLSHSFVESPDMMNIYNGIATLDGNGEAVVILPEWFETLNRDFRYQLTAVGAPGPGLYISSKVRENRFRIAGGSPGMEVSWEVTGIRQDPWANAHRIPVEQDKSADERGRYEHPELYGQPAELSIQRGAHPESFVSPFGSDTSAPPIDGTRRAPDILPVESKK